MNKYIFIIFFFLICCNEHKIQPRIITIPDVNINNNICEDKIKNIEKKYDTINLYTRLDLLYHVKASPILLLFNDKTYYHDEDSKIIKTYRNLFEKSNHWDFIDKNKEFLTYRKNISSNIFLINGYFYNTKPAAAQAMSRLVSLDMMFSEKELFVQRGSITMRAIKKNNKYYYVDGPFKDQYATIMIFDRISTQKPTSSLHIDFVPLQHKYGFNKINPTFINDDYIVADVEFKDISTKMLLNKNDLSFECETINTSHIRKDNKYLRNFQSAILANVTDEIPFDEPKYEVQQEDGNLRDVWMRYFYRGKTTYRYTNERISEFNPVYSRLGNPIPPQVCIDFLIDSIDRACGSWYSNIYNRKYPFKTSGLFNSSTFTYKDDSGNEKYYALRNIDGFKRFIKDYPDFFEVKNINDKVQLGSKDFFKYLETLKLKTGDMVFIKGSVPWDTKEHSHSFIIYETDPISGMPILLAGNANSSSLRPWKVETTRTPYRYIFMTVSIKYNLLKMMNNSEYTDLVPR